MPAHEWIISTKSASDGSSDESGPDVSSNPGLAGSKPNWMPMHIDWIGFTIYLLACCMSSISSRPIINLLTEMQRVRQIETKIRKRKIICGKNRTHTSYSWYSATFHVHPSIADCVRPQTMADQMKFINIGTVVRAQIVDHLSYVLTNIARLACWRKIEIISSNFFPIDSYK